MTEIIWSYRAVNNRIARKKWGVLVLVIFLAGAAFTALRIASGAPLGRAMIIAAIFNLFVALYAIIAMGKPRTYIIEDDEIIYKPFKARLSEIRGYEADYDNLIIKLRGARFIRTLYFEDEDDMKQVERFLRRRLG